MSVKNLIAFINESNTAIALAEDNQLSAESREAFTKAFEENTPTIKVGDVDHKLTIDNIATVDKYRAEFHEAYSAITKDLVSDAAKNDADLAALELTLDIGTTSFVTAWARPTGENPSQKDLAASIGFGYTTPKSKALEGKLRKEFAKSFIEQGDDEADDE